MHKRGRQNWKGKITEIEDRKIKKNRARDYKYRKSEE